MHEQKQLALQTFLLSWGVAKRDGILAFWFGKRPLELTNITAEQCRGPLPTSPKPGTQNQVPHESLMLG